MNLLQKVALFLAIFASFASCQSSVDPKQSLSDPASRKAIMETIAKDDAMSKEMMQTMMSSANGPKMMMGDHAAMMQMMQNNPAMMKGMMGDMMAVCSKDTNMMSETCKMMMENQPMMDRMYQMNGEKMDMKKMGGMNHKM